MTSPFTKWIRKDQGGATIEFSLISVAFVLVMLGVVEVSRLVLVYTTVANAARAGARYAIVHGGFRTGTGVDGPSGPGSVTQVQTVVQNYASGGLLTVSNLGITVSYPDGSNAVGKRVTVGVTYTYDPMISYFSTTLATTVGSTSEGVISF